MFMAHQNIQIDAKGAKVKLYKVIDNILRWKYNTVNS